MLFKNYYKYAFMLPMYIACLYAQPDHGAIHHHSILQIKQCS